jgi:DDE superfamily endonuclease
VGFPCQMKYGAKPKEWMDEDLMLHWIEQVWKPSVACIKVSYLLLVCCTSHLTTAVKDAYDDCNTELDFILKD